MNDLKNLNQLFNNCLYRIPDYQRGYSWGTQQLEEFWDDLLGMLPRQDHYTGMLSLKRVQPDEIYRNREKWINESWLVDNGFEVYEVVDGQQRLTTLVILVNEIYNYCKEHNLTEFNGIPVTKIVETFLMQTKNSENIIRTYKFGYEVDNPSYLYFKIAILGDPDQTEIEETFYTLNLSNTQKFFQDRLSRLSIPEVEEVYRKVTQHLKFNLYYIDNDFNVFVAFETMNNRGKRLSYLELLKNRLIYLSTLFNNEEDEKSTVRRNINNTWKEIYGYLGKNKNHPLSDDAFLQDHWAIYFGYNTRKISRNKTIQFHNYLLNQYFIQQNIESSALSTSLQPETSTRSENASSDLAFDENVPEALADADDDVLNGDDEDDSMSVTPLSRKSLKLADIDRYINSLKELIPFWYQTYEPSEIKNPEISRYVFRLNNLGFINARPLVAVLLSKKDISDELKLECLKKIERFNFLHFRLNNYMSTFKNSTFYNYARDLYFDNISILEIIDQVSQIDYLSNNNIVITQGPIERFEKLFKRDGFYAWNSLRYFLYIYDTSKAQTPAERIDPAQYFSQDPRDYYSIEHIFPQKPTDDYWLKNFDTYMLKNETKTLSTSDKKALTGSLGNLLPLSQRINSRLQNHSFNVKKSERYHNGSKSEMEVAAVETWTPDAILTRGLKLLDFMEREFDFKFPDDSYRKKVLGLKFMANQAEDEQSHRTEPIIIDDPKPESVSVYSEKDHLVDCSDEAVGLYDALRSRIIALGDITIEPKKQYIAFKHDTNICDIQVQNGRLKITLNLKSGELDDPNSLAKDMKLLGRGHWGNGDYEVILSDPSDLDDVMKLIEQSYRMH